MNAEYIRVELGNVPVQRGVVARRSYHAMAEPDGGSRQVRALVDALDQVVQRLECSLVREQPDLLNVLSLVPDKGTWVLGHPDPSRVNVKRSDEERAVKDVGALPDVNGEAEERDLGGTLRDARAPLLNSHLRDANGVKRFVRVVLGKHDAEDLRLEPDML